MPVNDFLDKSKTFEGKEIPEGQLILQDQQLLKKYSINKNLVVELGTFKGRGAVILSMFAKQVITVDFFGKGRPNNYELVKKDLDKHKNIKLIKKTTREAIDKFQNNSIDLLIQDAGHSIEAVVDDIKAYFPKLKNDAIVMIHDFKYMDGSCDASMDVKGGVKYLVDNKMLKLIEIAGWYWIGKIHKEYTTWN